MYMTLLGLSTILVALIPQSSEKFEYKFLVIIKMMVAFMARAMVSGAYTTI